MRQKLIFTLILLSFPFSIIGKDCENDEAVHNYISEQLKSYNPESIHVTSELKISDWEYLYQKNKLQLDGNFIMSWMVPSFDFSHLNSCSKTITWRIPGHFLWHPSTTFTNSVSFQKNIEEITVDENGTVSVSKRIQRLIPCKISIEHFPFSNATCVLSWKYSNIKQNDEFSWKNSNSNYTENGENQRVGSLFLRDTEKTVSEDNDEHYLKFTFSQNAQNVLFHFFIPALLFLIPPWLSLLLGPMAITRCCILMTSLILLSIHYHSNVPDLPQFGGVDAISVWKLFSYLFVISIVIELIIITLLASLGRSKTCCFSKRRSAKYEMEPLYEEMNDLRQRKTRKTRNCCRKTALFFDIASFVFAGIVLTLFCYGYYAERHAVVKMINEFEMESLNIL